MARLFLMLGAVNAALVVVAGAYGAHALKDSGQAAVFQSAVLYHMFHALGLLALGLFATWRSGSVLIGISGGLMLLGIVLFCGSLYLHAVTGQRTFTGLAPYGGTAFIIAWLLFAVAALRT